MFTPYARLMAVFAVAVLCLSPIVTATAALAADQSPDIGYARNGVVTDDPDLGYARNGVVTNDPDLGYARDGGVVFDAGTDVGFARDGGVVVSAPDTGFAREGGVVAPVPTASAATRADRGVDAETVVLATLTLVVIVGAGVVSFLVSWRRHHRLAHAA